ncbi:MAG: AN1-type zinc finger domain-containing protein [Promethearchaeota archaeon]
MVKCDYCNKPIGYLPFKCKYCGGTFCKIHRLPENHECSFSISQTIKEPVKIKKTRKTYRSEAFKETPDRTYLDYKKEQERQKARARKIYRRQQTRQYFSLGGSPLSPYLLLIIFIFSIVALVFPIFLCLSSYTFLNYFLWTYVTSLFVSYSSSYIGILFLLILILIFYNIIKTIEINFGTKLLFTLYLISAIGTALVYFLIWILLRSTGIDPYIIPSIGLASGALLGVICFLIYFSLRQEFIFLFFFLPIRMRGSLLIWLLILIRLIPGVLFAIVDLRYLAIYLPDLGGILASYIFYKYKYRLRI